MPSSSSLSSSPNVPSHDAAGVAHKLYILADIQAAARRQCGLPALCVVRVHASWPCTIQLSWISGGFSGVAAVVQLSNHSLAVALLASAQRSSNNNNNTATGGSYRLVCCIHASQILAHNAVDVELLEALSSKESSSVVTGVREGDTASAPAGTGIASPTAAAAAILRGGFNFSLAFHENDKAKYCLLERCPVAVLRTCFFIAAIRVQPRTVYCLPMVDEDTEQRSLEQQFSSSPLYDDEATRGGDKRSVTLLAVPLGATSSLSVESSSGGVTANAGPSSTARPLPQSQLLQQRSPLIADFLSVGSFREACLIRLSKSTFRLSRDLDFAHVSDAELALEVLWGLGGCRSIRFTADVNVKAATTPITPSAQATASGGGQTPSGSTVFSSSAATTSSAAASVAVIEVKDRTVVVCEGSLVLLKKKSAYPPPVWCHAWSWHHIDHFSVEGVPVDYLIKFSSSDSSNNYSSSSSSSPSPTAGGSGGGDSTKQVLVTMFLLVSQDGSSSSSSSSGSGGGQQQVTLVLPLSQVMQFLHCCKNAYTQCTGGLLFLQFIGEQRQQQPRGGSGAAPPSPNWLMLWPPPGNDSGAPRRYNPMGRSKSFGGLPDDFSCDVPQVVEVFVRFPCLAIFTLQWSLLGGSPVESNRTLPPKVSEMQHSPPSLPCSWNILQQLGTTICHLFAQQPNPMPLHMSTSPPLDEGLGRLYDAVSAAAAVSALTSTLRVDAVPTLPIHYLLVHQARVAAASSLYGDEGGESSSTTPTNARTGGNGALSSPTLPGVAYFILRGAIVFAGREFWSYLRKSIDSAKSSSKKKSSISVASGGGSPTTRPTGGGGGEDSPSSPSTPSVAIPPPAVLLARLIESLPRDMSFVSQIRQWLAPIHARLSVSVRSSSSSHVGAAVGGGGGGGAENTASSSGSSFNSDNFVLQSLSVLVLDVLVDAVIDIVRKPLLSTVAADPSFTAQSVSEESVLASIFSTSTSTVFSPASAQQLVAEWLASVLVLSSKTPHSSAVVVKGPETAVSSPSGDVPPSATAAGAQCAFFPAELFSLRSLTRTLHHCDVHLPDHAYGLSLVVSSSSASGAGYRDRDHFYPPHFVQGPLWPSLSQLSRSNRAFASFLSTGGLWRSMFFALSLAPVSLDMMERASTQISGMLIGKNTLRRALQHRTVSTQTTRTSAQEVQLLQEHLSLRSRISLSTTAVAQDELQTDAEKNSGASGGISHAAASCGIALMAAAEQRMVEEDDLESNKALLRRVLSLEQQLARAHIRNQELQDALQHAEQRASSSGSTSAMVMSTMQQALSSHVNHAAQLVLEERRLLVADRQHIGRESIAQWEAKERFRMTSGLLMTMMSLNA